VVEATAWRFRTGAPWRDLPERFGNWNTIYKNFDRWSKAGVWAIRR
jgi:transposase